MPGSFSGKLGLTLKRLRTSAGLSQIDMAQACKTSNQNLSKIERGSTTSINLEILARAAKVLNTDLYRVIALAEGVGLDGAVDLDKRERLLVDRFRSASESQRVTIEAVSTIVNQSLTDQSVPK